MDAQVAELSSGMDLGRLSDKQILLLTDNATMRRLVEQHLHSWSVTLSPQTSLPAADEAESLTQVDALIIDWAMAQTIQSKLLPLLQEKYTELPVVILTMLGEHLPELQWGERMATVTKPIHRSQLHDALVSVIYGKLVQLRAPGIPHPSTDFVASHPLRILLAEDNLVNQRVALGFLSKYGYRADVAANGIEVLEAVERQFYEMILMDIKQNLRKAYKHRRLLPSNMLFIPCALVPPNWAHSALRHWPPSWRRYVYRTTCLPSWPKRRLLLWKMNESCAISVRYMANAPLSRKIHHKYIPRKRFVTPKPPLPNAPPRALTITHKFTCEAAFRGRPRETLGDEITCGPSPERLPPLVHAAVGNGKPASRGGAGLSASYANINSNLPDVGEGWVGLVVRQRYIS